jgi:hypothetical protein
MKTMQLHCCYTRLLLLLFCLETGMAHFSGFALFACFSMNGNRKERQKTATRREAVASLLSAFCSPLFSVFHSALPSIYKSTLTQYTRTHTLSLTLRRLFFLR